jgi:hypothetical protein
MVVVSTGFHRTHMTVAAHEASVRGNLDCAVTGAYPTPRAQRMLRMLRLDRVQRVARLLEREEGIPPTQLRPLFLPELLDEMTRLCARIPIVRRLHGILSAGCMRLYGLLAARELERRRPSTNHVYHFRAGFGHASIERARQRGIVTLCDHARR